MASYGGGCMATRWIHAPAADAPGSNMFGTLSQCVINRRERRDDVGGQVVLPRMVRLTIIAMAIIVQCEERGVLRWTCLFSMLIAHRGCLLQAMWRRTAPLWQILEWCFSPALPLAVSVVWRCREGCSPARSGIRRSSM